jgi:hypothetical protein
VLVPPPETCATVRVFAPAMSPTEQAALIALKIGNTTSSMTARPSPSAPSRFVSGTTAFLAVTGAESLPRRPRPSKPPATRTPGVSRGTSQIVLAPSAASGRLDQTYAAARLADVTQLLVASRRIPSATRRAVETGAQNWLREPNSEKARVER